MFLDLGVAILISIGITKFFAVPLSFVLLLFALVSALLPDSDIFYYTYQKYVNKKKVFNHRSFLHYPLLYIIPAVVITSISLPLGLIFSLCIIFHLLHDTFFLGWGVVWLWPFKETRYKCFPDRDGKITLLPLVTWEKNEDEKMFTNYHNTHWVRDFYFRFTIVSVVEYSVFLLALTLLYITGTYY